MCGEFRIDQHLALTAVRSLPSTVHLRATTAPQRIALADALRAEVETANFGNHIVVRNLLSALFVYFMRDWAESSEMQGDWFPAVRTPHTARALARIHESPEIAWALEDMAKEAGLSRAAFARQFSAMVGEPPHKYLTRWRMGIASHLLTSTDLHIRETAARVGYECEFFIQSCIQTDTGHGPQELSLRLCIEVDAGPWARQLRAPWQKRQETDFG